MTQSQHNSLHFTCQIITSKTGRIYLRRGHVSGWWRCCTGVMTSWNSPVRLAVDAPPLHLSSRRFSRNFSDYGNSQSEPTTLWTFLLRIYLLTRTSRVREWRTPTQLALIDRKSTGACLSLCLSVRCFQVDTGEAWLSAHNTWPNWREICVFPSQTVYFMK